MHVQKPLVHPDKSVSAPNQGYRQHNRQAGNHQEELLWNESRSSIVEVVARERLPRTKVQLHVRQQGEVVDGGSEFGTIAVVIGGVARNVNKQALQALAVGEKLHLNPDGIRTTGSPLKRPASSDNSKKSHYRIDFTAKSPQRVEFDEESALRHIIRRWLVLAESYGRIDI
ncbi:hypothetical protein KCU65_g357, partial [Aureobasidium melanogenum]